MAEVALTTSLPGGSNRRFVLVAGPPGAGKTTLAAPLAAELELPLIANDPIKET